MNIPQPPGLQGGTQLRPSSVGAAADHLPKSCQPAGRPCPHSCSNNCRRVSTLTFKGKNQNQEQKAEMNIFSW